MNLAREQDFPLGGMRVRPSIREIVYSGGREVLEPRVMSVLVALARAGGEVVTRDDLSAACWDGRIVSDDAINRVISRIRRVSDLTGGRDFTLETVTKVGYRLVAAGAADAPPADRPAPARRRNAPAWLFVLAATLAAAIGASAWWFASRPAEWSEDPTASLTVAVLPFDNLGSAPEDDMLALGLSREIRNTLSRVRGLRVVSDSSSFAVAAEALSATEIGRRLKANLLLDGSFERDGDTIRLSVELVDPWEGVNLWAETQSGPASDPGALRRKVSSKAFEEIVKRVGPARLERLAEPRAADPRAYRLLVEASELLERASQLRLLGSREQSFEAGARANRLVSQALEIEPDSAMALFLMSRIVATGMTPELLAQRAPALEKQALAADYLRRALASDPDYAPALAALGEYYRRFEWRWETARAMLERAVALDPNLSDARLSYSYYLSGAGRCLEALHQAQAAVAIDPEFGWRTLGAPRALKCLGRFDESNAAYVEALRLDPDNPVILREMFLSFLMRRDAAGLERLRTLVRDELWREQPPEWVADWLDWCSAAIAAMGGDPGRFKAMIDAVTENGMGLKPAALGLPADGRDQPDVMWMMAIVHDFAGETDKAIAMLRGAVAGGALYIPETMPYGVLEFSAPMRADPRYQAIWRNDPRLGELMALRLRALEQGQMAGVLPDGRTIEPALPVDTRS